MENIKKADNGNFEQRLSELTQEVRNSIRAKLRDGYYEFSTHEEFYTPDNVKIVGIFLDGDEFIKIRTNTNEVFGINYLFVDDMIYIESLL